MRPRAPGQLVDGPGLALDRAWPGDGGPATSLSSAASIRMRSWLATSGTGSRDGRPSRLTSWLYAVGLAVGQLRHQARRPWSGRITATARPVTLVMTATAPRRSASQE